AVRLAADGAGERAVGQRMFEQAQVELLGQDPAYRIVHTRHWYLAAVHDLLEVGDELDVGRGLHEHVDPGVDRGGDFGGGEAGLPVDLVDGVPVGDQEAGEAQLALEHGGEQELAGGELGAVPAAEGDHDGADAGLYRGPEGRQVDGAQVGLGELGVA